jgi:quinoprotein glucose dehydrogenase
VPPSREGTVIFPGFDGGAEWGGAAYDQDTNTLYVNSNEMAWVLTMLPVSGGAGATEADRGRRHYLRLCATCHGADRRGDPQGQHPPLIGLSERMGRIAADGLILNGKGTMPSFGQLTPQQRDELVAFLFEDPQTPAALLDAPSDQRPDVPYTHTGYNRFLDRNGYPAVKPPWGTLNAIDLAQGTIRWSRPLGEYPELTARGVPPTGTENYGGPIVTAGGLVFIGATRDEKFRAFDKDTGALLFEAPLPAGGYATPATYSVGGKQYVVIACGGGKMGTRSGDAYVAFALP